jgi:hypothetical protein
LKVAARTFGCRPLYTTSIDDAYPKKILKQPGLPKAF